MEADRNVKLVAMGNAFEDRLQLSLNSLSRIEEIAGKVNVSPERRFVGFDAYESVLATDVDVVLFTAPPHFRPAHLEAAIDAGKHVFAEKPVAVDASGLRSVLKSCAEAKRKSLSVVSGLCLRHDRGFQETVSRLHDGAIGDIHILIADDYRGSIWVKSRQDDWTDMHWQMRNGYYMTWLSGDFNVEQHVHNLDLCAWLMGGYPLKSIGMGGRQVRTDPMFGNVFDHHSVTCEYESGARLFNNCRQQSGCKMNSKQDLSPDKYAWGSASKAEIAPSGITKFI